MINVPNLSWTNTTSGRGPVAQVALNWLTDTSVRISLRGGILGENVSPEVFTVDNLSNTENVTLSVNGVAVIVSASVRQLLPIAPGTNQIDVSCTGATRSATNLVFYADAHDAPPEQTNYSALIAKAVATALIPGFTMWWPGPIMPSVADWLQMDGASYATAAQPNLFAALGYTWGGAGANFNVPDARDCVLVGASPGGLAGNRPSVRVIGTRFGAETHTMTLAELIGHTHRQTANDNSSDQQQTASGPSVGNGYATALQSGASVVTQPTGSGTPFDITPPSVVGTFLIHT